MRAGVSTSALPTMRAGVHFHFLEDRGEAHISTQMVGNKRLHAMQLIRCWMCCFQLPGQALSG